jgi:hypothetical protein
MQMNGPTDLATGLATDLAIGVDSRVNQLICHLHRKDHRLEVDSLNETRLFLSLGVNKYAPRADRHTNLAYYVQ